MLVLLLARSMRSGQKLASVQDAEHGHSDREQARRREDAVILEAIQAHLNGIWEGVEGVEGPEEVILDPLPITLFHHCLDSLMSRGCQTEPNNRQKRSLMQMSRSTPQ